MELLKLMMYKSDLLSSVNNNCEDDRVPPIHLDQLPDFLICKSLYRLWTFGIIFTVAISLYISFNQLQTI